MTDIEFDKQHLWHPYSAMYSDNPVYQVNTAHGVYLQLEDGRKLIDGMSSWWCKIHGYNHPVINQAIKQQTDTLSHVMFGGLTHAAAIALGKKLLTLVPEGLNNIFYADSGSVAVEVALKMAIQYWYAKGKNKKQRFIALRHGYHGDTFASMSVSDPDTGMHSMYQHALAKQIFITAPNVAFGQHCHANDMAALQQVLQQQGDTIAALILEPVVQGAGGMHFYSADYLKQAKQLCEKYQVLLIADEIATGFGRTGKLFACEHAGITPDIMCIGKALTGGYMTLSATLSTDKIATTIDKGKPGVFMHGPTFMANPLACAAAIASIELLQQSNWQKNVQRIEQHMHKRLQACENLPHVADVRVLGAIGVIELTENVDMPSITKAFVEKGVWVRPFGKLVYLMPPFVISSQELEQLLDAVTTVVETLQDDNGILRI